MVELVKIKRLLEERKMAEIYHLSKKKNDEIIGFNLFELISDLYYRENFHSDVIKELLSPSGKHGEGIKYLRQFIIYLNNVSSKNIDFLLFDEHTSVTREQGKRDITISNGEQVIIIENKINNAVDTDNQVPKYIESVEKNGQNVLAVVYLTLRQSKKPSEITWKVTDPESIKAIREKLIIINAFNGTEKDLCNGWLINCINLSNDLDNLAILRQYKRIVQHLARHEMDQVFMEEFAGYLKATKSLEVAKAICENVNQLCKYTGLQFLEHFRQDLRYEPFKEAGEWENGFLFFRDYDIFDNSFTMDVIFYLDKCTIDFSARRPEKINYTQAFPQMILEIIGKIDQYTWNGNRFVHTIQKDILESKQDAIGFCESFNNALKDNRLKIEDKFRTSINI